MTDDATILATPPDDDSEEILSDEAGLKHFSWRLSKTLERRIDQYLVDRVGYLSRAEVQRLIGDGFVTVNGKTTKSSYKPKINDIVALSAPPPRNETIEPEDIPLDIVYEDDHMMAINKQAGLVIHPARGQWSGTLVNGLIHYGNLHSHEWSTVNGAWRPGILHRLDKNTTGIMLIAKSDEAHWRLARQFENRTIRKTYTAVLHGKPRLLGDEINAAIGRHTRVREKMAVRTLDHGAKEAITRYQVLQTIKNGDLTRPGETTRPGDFSRQSSTETAPQAPTPMTWHRGDHPHDRHTQHPDRERFSFVHFMPKTGRTHQLRVHAAHIGHPILGDVMYGGETPETADGWRFDRQALHATRITFTHPLTLKTMSLAAPFHPDMASLLRYLGFSGIDATTIGVEQ